MCFLSKHLDSKGRQRKALSCTSMPRPDSQPFSNPGFITEAAGQDGRHGKWTGTSICRFTWWNISNFLLVAGHKTQDTLKDRRSGNNCDRNLEGSDHPGFLKPASASERWSYRTSCLNRKEKRCLICLKDIKLRDMCCVPSCPRLYIILWRSVWESILGIVLYFNVDILCYYPEGIHPKYPESSLISPI